MDLSTLNVDVLLNLMRFVDPVDRFNLGLSGILKGFENVNKGIDLDKRYSEQFTLVTSVLIKLLSRIDDCGAELGLRRDSTCELEIRLVIKTNRDGTVCVPGSTAAHTVAVERT
jgi:hypothetical protein